MVKMTAQEVKSMADKFDNERNVYPKCCMIPEGTRAGNADLLRAEGVIARIYWAPGEFSDVYEEDLNALL